jgi:hypothetical protein
MPTVTQALQQFAQEHRHHNDLAGNADAATPTGYRLWAQCAYGERFGVASAPSWSPLAAPGRSRRLDAVLLSQQRP